MSFNDVVANWFLDPWNPTMGRYWDGTKWTEHVIPVPPGQSLPPFPVGPPPSAPYGTPYPQNQTTSGLAIASLVTSLLGLGLFGVIFGHIGLGQIKRSAGQLAGRGLAIAGVIIGYLEIALVAGAVIVVFAVGSSTSNSDVAGCRTEAASFETAGQAAKVAQLTDPNAKMSDYLVGGRLTGKYWTATLGSGAAVSFSARPGASIPDGCEAPTDIPA